MSQQVIERQPTPAPGHIAHKAASGFAWLTAQTLGAKAIAMLGQIVLAWFLIPEDFGLFGMAMTVQAFTQIIQQAGLREILIYRHRNYERWANSAFWMACALGFASGAVLAASAPLAGHFYHDQRVIGLLLVLAAAAPISGLDVVADARLQSQFRFGYLASTNLLTAAAQLVLSVLFARLGFGAYSFVLPRPFMSILRLSMLWVAARPPVRLRLQLRRWRYMIGDSFTLFAGNLVDMLTWQGDYILLGQHSTAEIVGIYFFAFNLSVQTMQLFTSNLTGVLFPALSHLQSDPKRQNRAFLNAARLLAIIAVPLCILQAVLADPVIHILFKPKWYPAIPVLQVLSLGMAIRVVASPGGSLLNAQGRFKTNLIASIINAMVFLSLVWLGATWYNDWRAATSTALAVAIYYTLIGPAFLRLSIHTGGGTMRDVLDLYWPSLLASLLAGFPAFAASHYLPMNSRWLNFGRIILVVSIFTALYLPLIRLLDREGSRSLMERAQAFFRRRETPSPAVA